jgi:hypothetical protein
MVCIVTNHKKTYSNAPNPAREAGTTIIEKQKLLGKLKPAKWVKLDTRLVGENTNKGCAPNLINYRRLLVITPTRAVHAIAVVFPWFVSSQTITIVFCTNVFC